MSKQHFKKPEIQTIEALSAELMMANQLLNEANKQLQDSERQRSEMIANISHDLRAPITAIRNTIDYLRSGHTISADDYQSALLLLDKRTASLEHLIQEFFLLVSIDNHKKVFHQTDIDAGPFLEEYFFSALADSKYDDRELLLEVDEHLKAFIFIEPESFIRVLDNLFTNALKYSHQGATIALGTVRNDQTLDIYIRDTGIGIPEDSIHKVFDRSYTVSDSRTPEDVSGCGLGLAIVKSIVEQQKGHISCESKLNVGSTFTISLPCK